MSPSFLKASFAGYRNLSGQFFFEHFGYVASIVSAVSFIEVLYKLLVIFLLQFSSFSHCYWLLALHHYVLSDKLLWYICLWISLFSSYLEFVKLPECVGYCFSMNVEHFSHNVFKYFPSPFSPLLVLSLCVCWADDNSTFICDCVHFSSFFFLSVVQLVWSLLNCLQVTNFSASSNQPLSLSCEFVSVVVFNSRIFIHSVL